MREGACLLSQGGECSLSHRVSGILMIHTANATRTIQIAAYYIVVVGYYIPLWYVSISRSVSDSKGWNQVFPPVHSFYSHSNHTVAETATDSPM